MAADFIINTDHRAVFSLGWGTLTFVDVIDHRTRLSKDARFCPDFKQIIDFSSLSAIQLSSDEIKQLAKPHIFDIKSRRAIAVVSSFQQGLSRMFQTYGDLYGGVKNLQVCQNLDGAIAWIDVPTEAANKAFLELRTKHDLA